MPSMRYKQARLQLALDCLQPIINILQLCLDPVQRCLDGIEGIHIRRWRINLRELRALGHYQIISEIGQAGDWFFFGEHNNNCALKLFISLQLL